MKFKPGRTVVTRAVDDWMKSYPLYQTFVMESLTRHLSGDWGDVSENDRAQNDEGIDGGGTLHSSYTLGTTTIWIITEWDRSVTTVLFPEDY